MGYPANTGQPPDLDPLAGLLAEVRAIQAGLSRLIDRTERLETKIAKVFSTAGGSERHWSRALKEVSVGMIAHSLLITRNPDASALIQVDGAKPFSLSPRLTDVLVRLAEDAGTSEDELVPWKSRDSIWKWLETIAGKQIDSQYVNKLICKLRLRLVWAGLDPLLIQTHLAKGVRFALKRGRANGPTRVIGGHRW